MNKQNEGSSTQLFVSDLDGTLAVDDQLVPGQRGDEMALAQLKQELEDNPHIVFGVATGRSLALVLGLLDRYNLPLPSFAITDVGSEIYQRHGDVFVKDAGFDAFIKENWERAEIVARLENFASLEFQEPEKQRTTKVSFYTGEGFDLKLVEEALVGLPCTIIFSHNELLDVLPKRASKAHAIRFVSEKLGVSTEEIAVAGDSGNDRDMLTAFKGIMVGNHSQEIADLRSHPNVYAAQSYYAAGVLEGLRHYGFLPSV